MKTLKNDEVDLRKYETLIEVIERAPAFIEDVYNAKRPHSYWLPVLRPSRRDWWPAPIWLRGGPELSGRSLPPVIRRPALYPTELRRGEIVSGDEAYPRLRRGRLLCPSALARFGFAALGSTQRNVDSPARSQQG